LRLIEDLRLHKRDSNTRLVSPSRLTETEFSLQHTPEQTNEAQVTGGRREGAGYDARVLSAATSCWAAYQRA
jgi:hypothetical protein